MSKCKRILLKLYVSSSHQGNTEIFKGSDVVIFAFSRDASRNGVDSGWRHAGLAASASEYWVELWRCHWRATGRW